MVTIHSNGLKGAYIVEETGRPPRFTGSSSVQSRVSRRPHLDRRTKYAQNTDSAARFQALRGEDGTVNPRGIIRRRRDVGESGFVASSFASDASIDLLHCACACLHLRVCGLETWRRPARSAEASRADAAGVARGDLLACSLLSTLNVSFG